MTKELDKISRLRIYIPGDQVSMGELATTAKELFGLQNKNFG